MTGDTENGTHEKIKELQARDDLTQEEKVERLERFTSDRMVEAVKNNRLKSKAELIQGLHDLAREHGEPITQEKMQEHGRFAPQTYVNRFDGLSWRQIVQKCGYEPGVVRPTAD